MGHFRKLLCGFPNCLCFLSHCSPPTTGSIGHAIVRIQYFKGCHWGTLNMCMTVGIYQSPPRFCRVWVPLLCVHWFVVIMLFIGHLCTLWPISCSSLNSVQVAWIIWRNCLYSWRCVSDKTLCRHLQREMSSTTQWYAWICLTQYSRQVVTPKEYVMQRFSRCRRHC